MKFSTILMIRDRQIAILEETLVVFLDLNKTIKDNYDRLTVNTSFQPLSEPKLVNSHIISGTLIYNTVSIFDS